MLFSLEASPDLESETGMQESYFAANAEYNDVFDDESLDALGVNPTISTEAKPGSEDKVLMLAARYAAGLPLWHESDCYDHGPSQFCEIDG